MKRTVSMITVLVLLVSLLAVPAQAAGSGSLAMTSASGGRGETVSLSVKLNSNPGLVTMSIRVSYDTSVLQLTNVSNSGLLVGAQLNTSYGSPYMITWVDGNATTNNTATGTIATFTFKILDNAAIGSSTVNLQFNDSFDAEYGENSFSAASGTVTVVCKNHNYSSWSKADDTNHSKTCSICQDVQTEAHKWDNGTAIKQANCKEGGQVKYTCTVCSATKTVDVEKTNDHKYGSWTQVNDATHKHTCSVCQKEETANHTWDKGTTIKQANCKEGGQIKYTCTGCKITKLEDTEKTTTHTYAAWVKVNDTTHKHTCTVCQKEETANHTWNSGNVTKPATCKEEGVKTFTCTGCGTTKTEVIAKLTTHTYDHGCDKDCNVCGAQRTTSHQYSSRWSKNKAEHWHECTECKDKKDAAAHVPGPEATENSPQTCTVCGYVIKAALGHTHSYAETWTTDEAGHWYACAGCEEKGEYAQHDLENDCDPDCSVCGYTRDVAHTFGETWESDADNHWHVCAGCGLKETEAAHEPGAEATESTPQTCTVCGYEIAPALGTETTEPAADSADVSEPETPAEDSFPWWILIVAVVVAGGAVVVITKRKKK